MFGCWVWETEEEEQSFEYTLTHTFRPSEKKKLCLYYIFVSRWLARYQKGLFFPRIYSFVLISLCVGISSLSTLILPIMPALCNYAGAFFSSLFMFYSQKCYHPENICIYALIYVLIYKKICISKVSFAFFVPSSSLHWNISWTEKG